LFATVTYVQYSQFLKVNLNRSPVFGVHFKLLKLLTTFLYSFYWFPTRESKRTDRDEISIS
jgi:hypothetical protein